jgi:hypothetical protein
MESLAGAALAEPVRGTGDLPTLSRVSAGPGWNNTWRSLVVSF